jgi:hypothetical protein
MVPILIEVPVVSGLAPVRVSTRSRIRLDAGRWAAQRRRRLRREVRLALLGALVVLPPTLAGGMVLRGGRPATARDSGRWSPDREPGSVHHPPMISLSIEPAAYAPQGHVEPPVVFPGYLLPDDGSEEPVHVGS